MPRLVLTWTGEIVPPDEDDESYEFDLGSEEIHAASLDEVRDHIRRHLPARQAEARRRKAHLLTVAVSRRGDFLDPDGAPIDTELLADYDIGSDEFETYESL